MKRYDTSTTHRPISTPEPLATHGAEPRTNITVGDPLKVLLAILLPPLGVFFEVGFKGHFWLNILLTLFGYIPGIIHALYVILRY